MQQMELQYSDLDVIVMLFSGVLGFPLTCLHAVMSLLSASLRTHTDITSPPIHPRLTELCYRVIYSLAANVRTSEPTLRFLRSSGDFIQRHLSVLPFKTSNKGPYQIIGLLDLRYKFIIVIM